ncbi:MAG TPA: hypothetical protein DER32_11690, partial [Deinococcus radiodurans]|nr:hypothetical protein [Deinococcus radiodurans]
MVALPPALAQASTVPAFGALLAAYACEQTGAHGTRVWVASAGALHEVACEGRGLALSDGSL